MRMERSLALGPLPLKDDMCPVIWATLCESDNEFDVFTGLEPACKADLAHHALGTTHHSGLASLCPRQPRPNQYSLNIPLGLTSR